MQEPYRFGKKEDRLLRLCRAGKPDFAKIRSAISDGADVNAVSRDGANLLYSIIRGGGCSGKYLPKITEIFISSGFHVKQYGRACLSALVYSTHDRYICDCARLLLSAGPALDGKSGKELLDNIGTEESYQRCCDEDHACENIYYAFYEMVARYTEGRSFRDIVPWKDCIRKTVRAVYAEEGKTPPVSPFADGKMKMETRLLFDCGDSAVIIEGCPNIYGCALDTTQLQHSVDLSELFRTIIGKEIRNIYFRHGEHMEDTKCYRQPIIFVAFGNGEKIRFSTNYGEVAKEQTANFFEIISKT